MKIRCDSSEESKQRRGRPTIIRMQPLAGSDMKKMQLASLEQ